MSHLWMLIETIALDVMRYQIQVQLVFFSSFHAPFILDQKKVSFVKSDLGFP
jgi:hypothetical protein